MSKECPFVPIDFNEEGREVVECDELLFPWKQDPNGYFLVKIEKNFIECGFVNSGHKMILVFRGKNPDKIIKEIAKRELVNLPHMGYIASEIMIAYNCIKTGQEYVQR